MPDKEVSDWLHLTAPIISEKRFGKLYEQAHAFLTAHRMKMAGLGDNSFGSIADTMRVGSYSEGETSINFTTSQVNNLMPDSELSLTQYGLSYLSLRRLVIIPIVSAGEAV